MNKMHPGRILAIPVALIVLQGVAILGLPAANAEDNRTIPYMLLVWSRMQNFDQQSMELLEDSPYNGTALKPFSSRFDEPVPGLQDFKPLLDELNQLKANSTKDLWPAVYLNRMVGYSPFEPPGNREYFRKIKGLDLDNETGARKDFEEIFALALRMALELDSPGIVVDLEAYNAGGGSGVNPIYHMDDFKYIRGEDEGVIVEKLQDLGRSLADITARIYPGCTIMFLFTGHDWTVSEIAVGLLDRAQELGSDLNVIDGGEVGIGYDNQDLDHLKTKVRVREEIWSQKFPYPADLFSLGGTIAPYLNRSNIRRPSANGPQIRTLRDFEPLFHELFQAFDYIWVYASGWRRYRPFDPQIGPAFNRGLKRIIDNYRTYGQKSPKLVENMIQELRGALLEAEQAGVNVSAYNQSLENALSLCDQDSYPEAYDLVNQTLSGVNQATENARRTRARSIINQAENQIELAREKGIDTTRCETCIEAARKALEQGHYQSAESLCTCAQDLQEKIPETSLLAFLACLVVVAVAPKPLVRNNDP